MPGTFSKASRPVRPGAYFNWDAQAAPTIPPAIGGIVAIPFTSDWGPFKAATLVDTFQEFIAVYGPTVGTPGYKAVWQAFTGEGGFEGRYGAGAVLCYRTGGSSAAKASKQLQNTTPVNAVTITAIYEGTYGNRLRLTTQDHAADPTQNELQVLLDTAVLETYVYTDTDIASLVTQINTYSDWIRATQLVTGVALTAVSASALTGGDDGSTMIAADWTALMSALEIERFGIFVPYGLTDSAILASIKAWAAGAETAGSTGLNTKGRRFETVVGGAAGETSVTAVTRSATLNDGNFVNLGQATLRDNNLLDAAGNPTILNTAEFAARYAGVLAQRGEAMSTTFARFPGVDLTYGPTESEILKAFEGGVVVFSRDSDPDAPVHVEKGITAYTNKGQPAFPYVIYRNPKYMRTMQNAEVEWTEWANRALIGKLPVNDKSREAGVAELQGRLRARQTVGIIQEGWTVVIDPTPPPSDDDEFIGLLAGIKFGRSVEAVFFTVRVG